MLDIILALIGGLAVGSFLNVVIFRLERHEDIAKGCSHCATCKHTLGFRELIPLLSFLLLAGRCRFCNTRISVQYPLVELATGLLFMMIFSVFEDSLFDMVFWLFFSASLVVIAVYDLKFQLVPGEVVWPLVVGSLLYILIPPLIRLGFSNPSLIWQVSPFFSTAFVTGGFILLLVVLTREKGMGLGDVPIAFAQGLLLGFPWGLLAFGLSFIIGALVGITLIVYKGAHLKTSVPFTPFLIVSLFIILLGSRL
jgi:leader peptidase (prepilin peptidase) / N-methyltransferase